MVMVDPSYFGYAQKRESSGDPFATNPRSSAKGLYQFTDGTWLDMMRKHPELGLTQGGQFDPEQSKRAMGAFTGDNADVLTRAGYAPTNDNLYAAHRFGSGGALKLLGSDPSASAEDVLSPAVLSANPDLSGKTVSQILGGSQGGSSAFAPTTSQQAPALDAISNALAMAPGAQAAQAPSGSPSFLDKLKSGGPGALIGLPNGMTSGGYDLGGAMMGAGAGLASIGNPAQGAALADLSKQANQSQYSMHVDPLTGTVYRIDTRKGNVSIINGGVDPTVMEERKSQATKMGEQLVTDEKKVIDNASTARTALANNEVLKAALSDPNVYQGFGGDAVNKLKSAAQAAGFKVDGVADAQLANAISRQAALQLRNPTQGAGMPGSLSNSDRDFLASMTQNLGNTREANALIADWQGKLAQHALDIEDQRQRYVADHGRIDHNWYTHLSNWEKSNPVFGAQDRAAADAVIRRSSSSSVQNAARPSLNDIFGK
jgi:hypothetical protein